MHTGEHLINLQWRRKSLQREWRFSASLNQIYTYGAQEWNVHWINKKGGEKKNIFNLKSDE